MKDMGKFKETKGKGTDYETIENLYSKPLKELEYSEFDTIDKVIQLGGGIEDDLELWARIDRTLQGYRKDPNIYYKKMEEMSQFPYLMKAYKDKKSFINSNLKEYQEKINKEKSEIENDLENKSANEILNLAKGLKRKYVTQEQNIEAVRNNLFVGMATGGIGIFTLKVGLRVVRMLLLRF